GPWQADFWNKNLVRWQPIQTTSISTFPLENRDVQCYRTDHHPYVACRKASHAFHGGPVVRDHSLERGVGGEGFFVAGSIEGVGGALPQLLVSALRLPAPGWPEPAGCGRFDAGIPGASHCQRRPAIRRTAAGKVPFVPAWHVEALS